MSIYVRFEYNKMFDSTTKVAITKGITTPKRGILPLQIHVKIWRLCNKNNPALRDNYSMEVNLLKYSHTSLKRENIINLFQ